MSQASNKNKVIGILFVAAGLAMTVWLGSNYENYSSNGQDVNKNREQGKDYQGRDAAHDAVVAAIWL